MSIFTPLVMNTFSQTVWYLQQTIHGECQIQKHTSQCQRYQKSHFEAAISTKVIVFCMFHGEILNLTQMCDTSNPNAKKR